MISLSKLLVETVLLAALGATVGLAVNHRLVFDAFSGRLAPTVAVAAPAGVQLPQPVLLEDVRELLAAGALAVDARDRTLFAEGHLPGALALPLAEADGVMAAFRQQVAHERTLVVYCSGYGCPDSFDLGQRLIAEGYRDVRVFEGGFPEWRDAGLPALTGEK